jgi:hypothetical protein
MPKSNNSINQKCLQPLPDVPPVTGKTKSPQLVITELENKAVKIPPVMSYVLFPVRNEKKGFLWENARAQG